MSDMLERIWGKEFAEKYRQALARAQQIPATKLAEIKKFAIEALKANPERCHVKCDNLDVILVQTPNDPSKFPVVKTGAGNFKVGLIWPGSQSMRGPFISVFVADKDTAQKLASTPGRPWLLVGKLQERTFEGDITYSFRVQGVIELE
jgi:hypothetical protein